MAKVVHGEWAAFHTQGGIRFQHNNKLISEKAVPPEMVSYLKEKLGSVVKENPVQEQPVQKFAPPSEEEKARLRAESLAVKPELERSDEEMAAARDTLTGADFDVPVNDAEAQGMEMVAENPELYTQPLDAAGLEPLPRTAEPAGLHPVPDTDFLDSISIHTASLKDIAEALYNRFGLYTVYLDSLPVGDEINPLTGEPFNKYHLGIAYQAAIRAQNSGILTRDPEMNRKALDQGRDASANFQDQFVPVPQTMGEARRADSFDYRTSVRGTQSVPTTVTEHVVGEDGVMRAVTREMTAQEQQNYTPNGATSVYDPGEDEPLVRPSMGKQVIRPNWAD